MTSLPPSPYSFAALHQSPLIATTSVIFFYFPLPNPLLATLTLSLLVYLHITFLTQFLLWMLPILSPVLSYYFTVYDLPILDAEQHTSIPLCSHHLTRCYSTILNFPLFGPLIPISPNICLLTNDLVTPLECISIVIGLHTHGDHKTWHNNAFLHWYVAALARLQHVITGSWISLYAVAEQSVLSLKISSI